MFYYVLPGLGIYGGIKKAFHCADALIEEGFSCAVASPSGGRPDWFPNTAPTLRRDELASACRAEDVILFSSPADAEFVDSLPSGRKIVHMQGASTPGDLAMMAPESGYEFISHGLHMNFELSRHGRVAPYVPFGIPEVFRFQDEPKVPGRVALMPRKGDAAVEAIREILRPTEELVLIDGAPEHRVAETLKSCELFVAISPDEAFGLPPLEAMWAGCVVVGYPGIGGFEYLRHLETAWLVPNGEIRALQAGVRLLLDDASLRHSLRERATPIATFYSMGREREHLLRALQLLSEARSSGRS